MPYSLFITQTHREKVFAQWCAVVGIMQFSYKVHRIQNERSNGNCNNNKSEPKNEKKKHNNE